LGIINGDDLADRFREFKIGGRTETVEVVSVDEGGFEAF
jgi:hypothetical protein